MQKIILGLVSYMVIIWTSFKWLCTYYVASYVYILTFLRSKTFDVHLRNLYLSGFKLANGYLIEEWAWVFLM